MIIDVHVYDHFNHMIMNILDWMLSLIEVFVVRLKKVESSSNIIYMILVSTSIFLCMRPSSYIIVYLYDHSDKAQCISHLIKWKMITSIHKGRYDEFNSKVRAM